MRRDVAHSLVILAGSLQGRVNAPVSEVKKKRPIFISVDNVDGLIRPIVCEIAARLKAIFISRVKAIGERHPRPQELIDRVKIQFCIHYIWVVFRQEKTTCH